MLIRAIRGENFMKFHRLCLEDLPAEGLIGIEGQNEGGKSTIGELVQFALFGKSISSVESSILELINWEQDQCAVELDFEVPEGPRAGVYRIWREVDRYGTNFARLTQRVDGADDEWRELASGLMQVQASLGDLVRFDFDDFTRSFFLAEREFPRSPEAMRRFLDRMVGADVLVAVSEEVRTEIQEREGEFGRQQAEIKRNQQQIEKYLPNIEKIPEVEKQRDALNTAIEQLRESDRRLQTDADDIEKALKVREAQRDRLRSLPEKPVARLRESVRHLLEGYPSPATGVLQSSAKDLEKVRGRLQEFGVLGERFESLTRALDEAKEETQQRLDGDGEGSFSQRAAALRTESEESARARGRNVFTGVFMALVGVALVVVGVGLLQGWIPLPETWQLSEGSTTFAALGVGGVFLVIAVVLWARAKGRRRVVERCARDQATLEAERKAVRERLESLAGFRRDAVRMGDVASELQEVSGLDRVGPPLAEYEEQLAKITRGDGLDKVCGDLAEDESRMIQRLRSAAKSGQKERGQVEESLKKEQSRRDRAETEIREYQKQEGRKAALEEQNAEIKVGADAIRDEIETRQLLQQLLEETVESIRHRAGPSLGKTMRKLLPSLTGGRYRDLKITPDFKLQVFTSDKSDFLSQHELSGGTFEGLSLGFRLAFSQAFIRAVVRGPQFLFLDEPFKAMDAARVHGTLSALVRLSAELKQIFVVIPGIRDADRELFDVIHQVTVGDPELGVGGVGRSTEESGASTAVDPASNGAPESSTSDSAEAEGERNALEDPPIVARPLPEVGEIVASRASVVDLTPADGEPAEGAADGEETEEPR